MVGVQDNVVVDDVGTDDGEEEEEGINNEAFSISSKNLLNASSGHNFITSNNESLSCVLRLSTLVLLFLSPSLLTLSSLILLFNNFEVRSSEGVGDDNDTNWRIRGTKFDGVATNLMDCVSNLVQCWRMNGFVISIPYMVREVDTIVRNNEVNDRNGNKLNIWSSLTDSIFWRDNLVNTDANGCNVVRSSFGSHRLICKWRWVNDFNNNKCDSVLGRSTSRFIRRFKWVNDGKLIDIEIIDTLADASNERLLIPIEIIYSSYFIQRG
jgi:hypothetical protein